MHRIHFARRAARPAVAPPRRRWRRRARRGQVAPVATILGLLLVVTFIANYLATTLPSQMSVNDLNHEVQVENQVGKLSALLAAVSLTGARGAEVVQPISLGTVAAPPFAAADFSILSRGNLSSQFVLRYTVSGPGSTTQTFTNRGAPGGTLLVHLQNTYATAADVAFDQGAVIYAQPGGYPLLVDAPTISFENGALSLWIPSFQGKPVTESGIGTAVVYSRLVSLASLSYPVNGFSIASGSKVSLTVLTSFPSVWVSYFNSIAPTGVSATCSGVRSVCSSSYQFSAPGANVTIQIPSVTSLSVTYASYAVAFS
jgi:hypothetical protein